MIYNHRSGACFREQRGDGLERCLHPCFHSLSKPRYEVRKLTHGECNGAVRESFPDWVLVGGILTLWCRRSCLLPHPCHVGNVSFCYPFLGRFSYPILFFPFCRLRLATGCYLLDVSRDDIDGRLFSFLLVGALGCVVPWLLAIETVYAGLPSLRAHRCDRD